MNRYLAMQIGPGRTPCSCSTPGQGWFDRHLCRLAVPAGRRRWPAWARRPSTSPRGGPHPGPPAGSRRRPATASTGGCRSTRPGTVSAAGRSRATSIRPSCLRRRPGVTFARSALPMLTTLGNRAWVDHAGAVHRVRRRPSVRPLRCSCLSQACPHWPTELAADVGGPVQPPPHGGGDPSIERAGGSLRGPSGSKQITSYSAVDPDIAGAAGRAGGTWQSALTRSITAPVAVVGPGRRRDIESLPAGFGILTGPDSGT
jgi:hypothetical protein